MGALIQYRRGTAAAWTSVNPTLAEGEIGYETDTYKVKIGDGATAWNSRAYFSAGGGGAWGSITGTLSAQTDLQTALNAKAALASPTFTGTLSAATITASGPVTGSNLSGTNTGDQTITLGGDASGSGTGAITVTIANNAVSLAKMATMATDSILGRATASTGNVEVLTALPFAYTGDVTRPADSNVTTIANNAVSLAKMATMATASLLGRNTAGTGNVEVITQASLPVSTATQTALNLKANLASPTFTGTVTTAAMQVNGIATHADELRLNATTPYLVFQNSGVQKGLIYTTSNIMFLNASDAAGEFRMQINGGTLLRQQTDRLTLSTVVRLHNAAADPTGANGDMYYNTATNKFRGYAGGAWIDLH